MPITRKLADASSALQRILKRSLILTPPSFGVSEIRLQTVTVRMRDGVQLATDIYLPPITPAPAIAVRTPYSRAMDGLAGTFLSFARRGYAVVSQDCRGTGDSEPEHWDYYMYEPEDSYDLVEWVSRQDWFNGFLASCGSSYLGQTQWQMAMHARMSAIVPGVSGLGVAINTVHLHMYANAYARSVGKGEGKIPVASHELESQMLHETLSTGYFNDPLYSPLPEAVLVRFPHLGTAAPGDAQRWLWEHYCSLGCASRAEFVKELLGTKSVSILEVEHLSTIFGNRISHDAHTLPHPQPTNLCRSLHGAVLMQTGWYDWGLNDALATWELLQQSAPEPTRSLSRLLIAPSAHNMPGYHEGTAEHPELHHAHGVTSSAELLMHWFQSVQQGRTDTWPAVVYYLMGANEWCAADAWPLAEASTVALHLYAGGRLSTQLPEFSSTPDTYTYDPENPTPTVGGSIVSYIYPAGSVNVAEVQKRLDVLTYTTPILQKDLDVIGPLRLILYASSSAVDTDFVARLSDVFPDGRAIQLQNGILRARYRNLQGEPELLEPGRIYHLEIDMWATANRFKVGHRLRLDISSADFPRFDRNSNRGGQPGEPHSALQTIYHDRKHPSHLLLPVVGNPGLSLRL